MLTTQDEVNTRIDGTVAYLIKIGQPVTANTIYHTLESWWRGTVGDAENIYWSHEANIDLDAMEDILQHSYDLIV